MTMTLADDVRLLCTVIDSGNDHRVYRWTKLQKITYFCRYYGWSMSDYKPHYCGPFSFNLAGLVGAGCKAGMMDEEPYVFTLTDKGGEFLAKVSNNRC